MFIYLEELDGTAILVNFDNVNYIYTSNGVTFITLERIYSLQVKETTDEIHRLMIERS